MLSWRSWWFGKPFCSLSAIVFRDAPFTEGSVIEGSGNNVLNNITPTVLRQAIKELRTQSHLTRTAINTYCRVDLHCLVQAWCCLKRFRYPATRQRDILPSTWDLKHCPPYSIPAYNPISTYPPQPLFVPSRSLAALISSIDFSLAA